MLRLGACSDLAEVATGALRRDEEKDGGYDRGAEVLKRARGLQQRSAGGVDIFVLMTARAGIGVIAESVRIGNVKACTRLLTVQAQVQMRLARARDDQRDSDEQEGYESRAKLHGASIRLPPSYPTNCRPEFCDARSFGRLTRLPVKAVGTALSTHRGGP